jgi:hypothetical protein
VWGTLDVWGHLGAYKLVDFPRGVCKGLEIASRCTNSRGAHTLLDEVSEKKVRTSLTVLDLVCLVYNRDQIPPKLNFGTNRRVFVPLHFGYFCHLRLFCA